LRWSDSLFPKHLEKPVQRGSGAMLGAAFVLSMPQISLYHGLVQGTDFGAPLPEPIGETGDHPELLSNGYESVAPLGDHGLVGG